MQKEIKPPFPSQPIDPPGKEAKMDPAPQFDHPLYKGSEKLAGKIALITGGDSGIGRSVAVLFAREGADVAFTYLPEEKIDADKTCELIQSEGRNSLAIKVDLTDEEGAKKVVDKCIEKYKQVDVLVNNAAFQNHLDDFDDLDFEQFYHTFNVNIFSTFKIIKEALPYMKEESNIINTSSILGYSGDGNLIDYASTKGAIRSFTKSLAKNLIKRKIRVNSVAPGPVWTPLNPAERDYDEVKEFGKDTLFKRPAQPYEIASAFVFLASEITGSYITGETINVFGDVLGQ